MASPILIIKSNAGTVSDVLIKDMGIYVPLGGGQVQLDRYDDLLLAQKSVDLRAFLVDSGFGAGSHTLIINDGTVDIASADADAYLEALASPDATNAYGLLKRDGTGGFDANNVVIGNVADPVADQDAANKRYVDNIAQGLDPKESVRALSDSNVVLTGTQTIDGVALADSDRVLLNGQTTASENGIWIVRAGAWERPADFDTGDGCASAFTFVEEGTVNADTGWVCTNDVGSDTIDTDNLSFVQFTGAGQISAGAGLTKAGNVISADFGVVGDVSEVGAANAAGVLDQIARIDHTHAHGDRGVDGAVSQHDGDQIDIEGVYTVLGSPGNVETAISNINDRLGDLKYTGKVMQFGLSRRVTPSGRFLEGPGGVSLASAPVNMARAGVIKGASIRVDTADSSNAYKVAILINNVEQGNLTLAANTTSAQTDALNISYAQGDDMSLRLEKVTPGGGNSAFDDASVYIELYEGD